MLSPRPPIAESDARDVCGRGTLPPSLTMTARPGGLSSQATRTSESGRGCAAVARHHSGAVWMQSRLA